MFAIAAMALTLTSCKKEAPKTEAKPEVKEVVKEDVEGKAKGLAAQCKEAVMNQQEAKTDSLEKVFEDWTNTLSAEDKKKAEDILKAAMAEVEAEANEANAELDALNAELDRVAR